MDFWPSAIFEEVKMQLEPNKLKRALGAGKLQIGLWSSLCSPIAAEIIADSGFDWIVVDMEHAPNEIPTVMTQLQIMAASGTNIVVRPPWNDMVMIKRVLDIGARCVLLPYVQNAKEAKRAVEYVRYPSGGVRGVAGGSRASRYGRIKDYLTTAADEICLLLQVETIEALEQLEDIAAIDGVDGIFIGPADLSASMGHLGDTNHKDVRAVIKKTAQRMNDIGLPGGILALEEETARTYIDWGYKFVAVGNDVSLLARASDNLCQRFKD